jgi:hypothetical protein
MGPRHVPLVSDYDSCISFFKDEYLFRVVVLVKRNSLSSSQSLGENEKIVRISVLAVELDSKRHTP